MFLVNSRLGHFSATSSKKNVLLSFPPKATLLPKLRVHFAEFLNAGSLERLRILIPPTCVGFRYGPFQAPLRDYFLAPWLHPLRFSRRSAPLNSSSRSADFPAPFINSLLIPGLPSPGRTSPHASSHRHLLKEVLEYEPVSHRLRFSASP